MASTRRSSSAKRAAVITAACEAFARDGFTRASIDAIAERAGVSTRTIYNHFPGKEDLFVAVLLEGADQVAEDFGTEIAAVASGTDVRTELLALARAFVAQRTALPEHFALIAQVRADVAHIPREVVEAWHEAGPLRVLRALAERLAHLADEGLLRIVDADRATRHLVALVTADTAVRPPGAPAPEVAAQDEELAAGVDAFLAGYGP